jgi:hypothetical protein
MEAEFIKTAFVLVAGILIWIMTRANVKTSNRVNKK